jgi:hypothetical protein
MDEARKQLFQRFSELHIVAVTVPYPAHRTVEEGKQLRLATKKQSNKTVVFSGQCVNICHLWIYRNRQGGRNGDA